MAEPMTSGWHYLKSGASEDRRVGPLSWEELRDLAGSGSLWPIDLVWHPTFLQWLEAGQVAGLFPVSQEPPRSGRPRSVSEPSVADDASDITARTAPLYQAAWTGVSRRRHVHLLPLLFSLVAFALLAALAAGYYYGFWHRASATPGKRLELGTLRARLPDPERLILTDTWGEVPANQVGVMLDERGTRSDAVRVASALGGTVVGEVEFVHAYQIQTQGRTEADLRAALEMAATLSGVEEVFPNVQTVDHSEVLGARASPLNDQAYQDDGAAGLELIGAQKAWDYIRGSGLTLARVHVGIVDNGVFRGSTEFSGVVELNFPDRSAGEVALPSELIDPVAGEAVTDPVEGHGTMVCATIGADPDNGGMTGLASPALRDLLTLSMIDRQAGPYGTVAQSVTDPEEPSRTTWVEARSYAFADLVAIAKEVEVGARIINCSWGADDQHCDAGVATAYGAFFEKMASEYPDVLFVCSAGNDGGTVDGSECFPGGALVSNMITVGNVYDDGTAVQTSTTANTLSGREYEVSLAAPGEQAVQGVDADGEAITDRTDLGHGIRRAGGTSLAAAQVTATAALMLSIDPKLTAAEVKEILIDTGRPGPQALGGKILAMDEAVLLVIGRERARLGRARMTAEELQKAGVIDSVAISRDDEGTWIIKSIVEVVPSRAGMTVTVTATPGVQIKGVPTRRVMVPREVIWAPVVVPQGEAEITVTRSDNGASSTITLGPSPQ